MARYLTLFHGSKNKFSKFDEKFIGSAYNTGGAGPGFYFTPDIEEAAIYGNYIYECRVKLVKSLNNHKKTLFTPEKIRKFFRLMYKQYGENYYENYGYETFEGTPESEKIQISNEIYQYIDSDTEFISSIMNSGNISVPQIFHLLDLYFTGINYTIDKESNINHSHYILYNPKDIKILNVTKY